MNEAFLKWVPVVDEDLCTGCAACVEACGPNSLEMVDRVAVLARPDTCGSEEHCIAPCPTTAIQMAWVELNGDKNRGKWKTELHGDATVPVNREGTRIHANQGWKRTKRSGHSLVTQNKTSPRPFRLGLH